MFKSVTVTNYMDDSLELPLQWPNDAGLLISNIDGITPGNVQVNSQDYAMLDGGVYNSSRMRTRNITIEMYYGFSPQIESARHRTYQYFPVKTKVRLDFLTDERWLSIWGYVESNEVDIFSEQEKGQVSIVCPDPYFYERDPVVYTFGNYIPEFEFPFSNESLTEPLICFSDYGSRNIYDVEYNGDLEVGAKIRVHFLKEPTIPTLKIYSVTANKLFTIDFAELQSKAGITVRQYDDIVFNSVKGEKDIYHERFGIKKSIMSIYDVTDFPWMYLYPGKNQFTFEMDEGYYDEVEISIEHRGAYGGV